MSRENSDWYFSVCVGSGVYLAAINFGADDLLRRGASPDGPSPTDFQSLSPWWSSGSVATCGPTIPPGAVDSNIGGVRPLAASPMAFFIPWPAPRCRSLGCGAEHRWCIMRRTVSGDLGDRAGGRSGRRLGVVLGSGHPQEGLRTVEETAQSLFPLIRRPIGTQQHRHVILRTGEVEAVEVVVNHRFFHGALGGAVTWRGKVLRRRWSWSCAEARGHASCAQEGKNDSTTFPFNDATTFPWGVWGLWRWKESLWGRCFILGCIKKLK